MLYEYLLAIIIIYLTGIILAWICLDTLPLRLASHN